jgi:RHS repeat-associated protein
LNPFQYTGRESDVETGLYYYRARYYDSNTGRFMSEDPARFVADSNFYEYVQNSPTEYRDPYGLIHQAWFEKPWDGRLHDDVGSGLEVLCTKGRNLKQDISWLEHSIMVRGVEIGTRGNNADANHVERFIKEVITLARCHEECDKDKKPDPKPKRILGYLTLDNNGSKIARESCGTGSPLNTGHRGDMVRPLVSPGGVRISLRLA